MGTSSFQGALKKKKKKEMLDNNMQTDKDPWVPK